MNVATTMQTGNTSQEHGMAMHVTIFLLTQAASIRFTDVRIASVTLLPMAFSGAGEIVRLAQRMPDVWGIGILASSPHGRFNAAASASHEWISSSQPGERNLNYAPYAIDNKVGAIHNRTPGPNATHVDGTVEYDFHNLFGHRSLNATYYGLQALFPDDRPFVIGRSTFSGSGTVAGHWGGDNQYSGDTTEELCGRWMQLSAFFSFYRNHYEEGALKHEAWRWPSVADFSREIMKIRYSLFPYMYTLLNDAHETGFTFLRALSWEFPQDSSLFGIDAQFLVGPGLMYTQAPAANTSGTATIDAPPGVLPLYIRGGTILPQQAPGYTVYESRQGSWSLLVALDEDGNGSGTTYLDDGKSMSPQQTQRVTLAAQGKTLTAKIEGSYDFADYGVSPPPLDKVIIMGLSSYVENTTQFNGKSVGAMYNAVDQTLIVQNGLLNLTSTGAWAQE
ncbi:glycosyl hydrolases family 31-domain-containing protein [Xylariaceae sp. FL0255]|nr:glycosyl hydrolases family 31-domain-containing protein [Xylariaceae sp. FL0255]